MTFARSYATVRQDEQLLREALEALKDVDQHNRGHGFDCDECNHSRTAITKLEERLVEKVK